MTELSFLIELLLNHKLPKATKDLIAERVKEVEGNRTAPPRPIIPPITGGVPQAASTIAAFAREGLPLEPAPVTQIAQTPAAAAALVSRESAIADAMKGIADSSGKKRKW